MNIPDEDVLRLLHSLACAKYKILLKDPPTKNLTKSDSFSMNTKFTSTMRRLKVCCPCFQCFTFFTLLQLHWGTSARQNAAVADSRICPAAGLLHLAYQKCHWADVMRHVLAFHLLPPDALKGNKG